MEAQKHLDLDQTAFLDRVSKKPIQLPLKRSNRPERPYGYEKGVNNNKNEIKNLLTLSGRFLTMSRDILMAV
jgi:hypothetical protein